MAFVACCLLIAVACCGFIIVALIGAIYELSKDRNDERDRADHLEDEADALQVELNAALGRLSRKRKPALERAS